MKAIGEYEIGEYVRPPLPKFYVSGPYPYVQECAGMFLRQTQEYLVYRKFEATPSASRAQVMVEDGYKIGFLLEWHTPMLSRYEALPDAEMLRSIRDKLSETNQEFLVELFKSKQIQTGPTLITKIKNRRYRVDLARRHLVATFTRRQMVTCLKILMGIPDIDGKGVTEEELIEVIRANALILNTQQDPWRVFSIYLKDFRDCGLVVVEDN
jgi:hypothetical protein